MDSIKVKAMAKINLGLDVLNRREDGYHNVRMIMQSVNLYDTIFIKKTESEGISIQTNLSYLPTNQNNLVYKAAKLLIDEFELSDGLKIILEKHIPVAAGMAGGSSDAAATLVGMNKLFGLNLSKKELMQRGVSLGADIPFCLMRGTALSEGIGEVLTPLPHPPKCHVLIAKPDISVSTKYVYDNLKLNEKTKHPNIDSLIAGLALSDLHKIAANLGNVLEDVTVTKYPIIKEIKDFMLTNGALGSLMSGSGPTVFGLYEDLEIAKSAKRALIYSGLAKDIILTGCFIH